jgi:small subunit ribosomal protein S9
MTTDKITIGRRKAAVARVIVKPGTGAIIINGKDYKDFFPLDFIQRKVEATFQAVDAVGKYDVTVNVFGGGVKGQAEAIVLGIARSLIIDSPEMRPALKKAKFLRRDAREVERKKTGLRKARKREQYSKR